MEKLMKGAKLRRISFSAHRSPPPFMNQSLEKPVDPTAPEMYEEESKPMAHHYALEVTKSPHEAIEFLSRTWSPSSSDLFQILSTNGLLPCLEEDKFKEHNEEPGMKGAEVNKIDSNVDTRLTVDHLWTWLSNGKIAPPVRQRHKLLQSTLMNAVNMKSWLSQELLGSLSKGCRKKRKDESRLHVAQVHAALSVTRLAAAISGIVANCRLDPISSEVMNTGYGGWDKKTNSVVASAAALVATVCAEAAESVGANRALISSAINSGLAAQNTADIATLTAAAATCLRGAATLEQRVAATTLASEYRTVLSTGAQLPVFTPAGKVQLRMVCIHLKHGKLILRLGKKYLGGALTTYKEYRVTGAMEVSREGGLAKHEHGLNVITLGTTEGAIQVLFEDNKQYGLWKSTITHLLSDH